MKTKILVYTMEENMQNKGMKVVVATLVGIILAGGYSLDSKASIVSDVPGAGIAVVMEDTVLPKSQDLDSEKLKETETKKADDNSNKIEETKTKEDETPEVKNEYEYSFL